MYDENFIISSISPPKSKGTLKVNGTPGDGQSSDYDIFACGGNLELPEKYSCHNLTKQKLNEGISLEAGVYLLV